MADDATEPGAPAPDPTAEQPAVEGRDDDGGGRLRRAVSLPIWVAVALVLALAGGGFAVGRATSDDDGLINPVANQLPGGVNLPDGRGGPPFPPGPGLPGGPGEHGFPGGPRGPDGRDGHGPPDAGDRGRGGREGPGDDRWPERPGGGDEDRGDQDQADTITTTSTTKPGA